MANVPRKAMTDDEAANLAVEMSRTEVNVARIARKVGISIPKVRKLIAEADEAEMRRIREGPESIRGEHVRLLNHIATTIFESIEEARTVRDDKGAPVVYLDPKTGKERRLKAPANPRSFRPVMEALRDIRSIGGLDAPSKSESLNVNANVMVDPAAQQRMLLDPQMVQLQLQMEERQRELLANAGRSGLPGPVRGSGQPREVEVGPPPPGDQQAPAGGGGGPEPPRDDLRAAQARQE